MKISVIIPVYNVGNYLQQCVDSVLAQTYQNIELILVDDGSTDESVKICDNYVRKDSRISVIHKKNGGLSDARNVGLVACTGDYVAFLDSDDYWSGDFLGEIVDLLIRRQPDLVTMNGYTGVFEKGTEIHRLYDFQPESFVYHNGEKFLDFVFTYKSKVGIPWGWEAWSGFYRTTLLRKNNLYFKKGILNEDAEWTPRVILASNDFDFYPRPYYVYRLSRPNSITSICSPKKVLDYLTTVNNWICYADKLENKALSSVIKQRFSNNFFTYLKYVYNFDPETREHVLKHVQGSNFLRNVTDLRFQKWVRLIEQRGYSHVLKRLNRNYKNRLSIKKIAIRFGMLHR